MKIFLKDLFLTIFVSLLLSALLAMLGNFLFDLQFENKIYPGVKINEINFGGLTKKDVANYFNNKLELPSKVVWETKTATFSARPADLGLEYDVALMGDRALSIGRQTDSWYYNFLQKLAAISGGINLPVEISYDGVALDRFLNETAKTVELPAVEGQFRFDPSAGPDQKGRVVAFSQSKNGLEIDRSQFKEQLKKIIIDHEDFFILPTKIIYPGITTDKINLLGIKDLLGSGTSYFYDSIPGRVANIKIGTEKISGSLLAPGEIFSFNEAIGTVSAVFGFSKAYVIRENRTVLEDGGGVCQVSTTLYRAALNSGLPIEERVGHAYRVPFYEQGGFKPGLDATVYPPNPDFRFKNDTSSWLLLQATFDEKRSQLTFDIFGASDGRVAKIEGPFFLSTTPPPDPVYEDDPTSPIGQMRQVDSAHWGAHVYFRRLVTRDGQELINETVSTSYIPWPARFLRGTKVF
jgi:vancomycin resistance protein YoaR